MKNTFSYTNLIKIVKEKNGSTEKVLVYQDNVYLGISKSLGSFQHFWAQSSINVFAADIKCLLSLCFSRDISICLP